MDPYELHTEFLVLLQVAIMDHIVPLVIRRLGISFAVVDLPMLNFRLRSWEYSDSIVSSTRSLSAAKG